MATKLIKCENCGGKVEYNDKQQLVCTSCGSLYVDNQDINKTYVSNTVVKNYYGKATTQEISNEKIKGLLFQVVNCIGNGSYSDARRYCVSIIEKDPYNWIATVFKGYIDNYAKQSNDRYKTTFDKSDMFTLLEYTVQDENQIHYYDIFYYYKELLKTLISKGNDSDIELCDRYIDYLNDIEFDIVQDFVATLKKFRDEIKSFIDKTKLEKDKEEEKITELEYLLKNNRRYGLIIKILILVAIVFLFLALR